MKLHLPALAFVMMTQFASDAVAESMRPLPPVHNFKKAKMRISVFREKLRSLERDGIKDQDPERCSYEVVSDYYRGLNLLSEWTAFCASFLFPNDHLQEAHRQWVVRAMEAKDCGTPEMQGYYESEGVGTAWTKFCASANVKQSRK